MLNLTVVDFNLKFRHFDQMFVMKFDLYSAKTHCMCWYQFLTCSATQGVCGKVDMAAWHAILGVAMNVTSLMQSGAEFLWRTLQRRQADVVNDMYMCDQSRPTVDGHPWHSLREGY